MANYLMKCGEKARTVSNVLWVESLERKYGEQWESRLHGYLAGLLIPVCCSPIHDKDEYTIEDVRNWTRRHTDPDTGEVADEYTNQQPKVGDHKKPHVHIILVAKGPRTREDFSELMEDLIDVSPTSWCRVVHLDALTRYFAHLDNPEKAKYEPQMVKAWGGFSLRPLAIVKSDDYSKYSASIEVTNFIQENKVKYYNVLWDWAKNTGDIDLMSCVRGNASHWVAYFGGLRQQKVDKAMKKKADEKQAQAIAHL